MLWRYAREKPVFTAHNGVKASASPAFDGVRPFTVGTVGTVSRLKGTDVFLRAASLAVERRPTLRFEHAGQPDLHRDVGLDEELALLLGSRQLRGTTSMLGRVEAAAALSRWDLFVLPSRMEAFPLATLEAMGTGTPVVASRVGGIPEQITHLEHGVLVPPGDPEALAEWIVRLHDDAALRSRLSAAACRRVREEFTLERQAAGLHHAYLVALNRRFGPPPVRRAPVVHA
jgi:glycosyltransferase involved in cell wall biosynthesis